MKKTRKIFSVLLVLALALACLCACGPSEEEVIAQLAGSWQSTVDSGEEDATEILQNIDFCDEEIELCDLDSLKLVKVIEFEGNAYRFTNDVEASKATVRQFFDGCMKALYEGRTTLNEIYEIDFASYTQEQFFKEYASWYSVADYDALLDAFVDNSYDFEVLGSYWETGTFTVDGGDLMCTIDGEDEAEALGYEIDGDSLVLTYIDAVENYTRK